jgi:hypothetical protein
VLCLSQAWWYTPVIPVFGRLRQEVHEFEASLVYTARSHLYLKKKKKKLLPVVANGLLTSKRALGMGTP